MAPSLHIISMRKRLIIITICNRLITAWLHAFMQLLRHAPTTCIYIGASIMLLNLYCCIYNVVEFIFLHLYCCIYISAIILLYLCCLVLATWSKNFVISYIVFLGVNSTLCYSVALYVQVRLAIRSENLVQIKSRENNEKCIFL